MPGDLQQPILQAWSRVLRERGDAPAILGTDRVPLRTFAEIEADAVQCPLFRGAEIPERGSVIAVQIGNSPFLPGLLLGLWRAGCVPVLLDRSLEGAARENALTACGAAGVGTLEVDCLAGERWPVLHARLGRRLDAGTDFLKLTSGTSNAPRAIRFTAAQLLADCESICDTMGIRSADLNFGVIPWSHSYGFSNLITPLLCRGVPLVATEDRLPRAILNGLISSMATVFPGLPVFFQKLCELPGARPAHLRLCISAGAPLPGATAEAFRAQFGQKIHGFYGSSECGGITYDSSEEPTPQGCVGEAMRGVTLSHDEATGRIEVRSAAVGLGYLPDPEPEVLGDGRFVPGDLLEHAPHGYVIVGRVSDFINIAGRKLNPLEVEHAIREFPGVREVIVFGVPHPRRGEEPIACFAGDATTDAVQSHCAKLLPAWQVPRVFWKVDALPVNERGKISRRGMADLYAAR